MTDPEPEPEPVTSVDEQLWRTLCDHIQDLYDTTDETEQQ